MVVTQVELDQLPEGAHVYGQAAELAPTQIHHLVQRHLAEVSDHEVLAAVSRDEGHKGPDGVPHAEAGGMVSPAHQPMGLLPTALRPVLPSCYSQGGWGPDSSQSLQQRKVLLIAT